MRRKIIARNYLFYVPAMLSLLVYLVFSIYCILYTPINFDEGSYAYKGYYFISGDYRPFQDYGFWTNKMPLAFLVPGIFQHLAPGILTGRLLAMAFGLATLAGSYCLATRLAGRKAGLVVLAVSAFSLSMITNYSMAITQSMTAALLIWAFYFVIHDDGKRWRVYLGSLLAILAIFTRQNMVFALPVIWLYVITQKKAGNNYLYTLAVLAAFIGMHIPFWPNIMTIWVTYLPDWLHTVDRWRLPGISLINSTWITPTVTEQLRSIADTFLTHACAFLGGFLGLMILVQRKRPEGWKDLALLAVSFWVLAIPHGLATIGSKSMNSGFINMSDFFSFTGLIVFSVILANEDYRKDLAILIVFMLGLGLALGNYYKDIIRDHWENIPVPYFSFSHGILSSTSAVGLVQRITGLQFEQTYTLVPPVMGGVILLLIILIALILLKKQKGFTQKASIVLTWLFLGISILAQPIGFGLGLNGIAGCKPNVVKQDTQIRTQLGSYLPEPSIVMLASTDDMIYLVGNQQLRVPPAITNRPWSLRTETSAEEALRVGVYTQSILDSDFQSADYLLIAPGRRITETSVDVLRCYQYFNTIQADDVCTGSREILILENICQSK